MSGLNPPRPLYLYRTSHPRVHGMTSHFLGHNRHTFDYRQVHVIVPQLIYIYILFHYVLPMCSASAKPCLLIDLILWKFYFACLFLPDFVSASADLFAPIPLPVSLILIFGFGFYILVTLFLPGKDFFFTLLHSLSASVCDTFHLSMCTGVSIKVTN